MNNSSRSGDTSEKEGGVSIFSISFVSFFRTGKLNTRKIYIYIGTRYKEFYLFHFFHLSNDKLGYRHRREIIVWLIDLFIKHSQILNSPRHDPQPFVVTYLVWSRNGSPSPVRTLPLAYVSGTCNKRDRWNTIPSKSPYRGKSNDTEDSENTIDKERFNFRLFCFLPMYNLSYKKRIFCRENL